MFNGWGVGMVYSSDLFGLQWGHIVWVYYFNHFMLCSSVPAYVISSAYFGSIWKWGCFFCTQIQNVLGSNERVA